MALTPRDLHLTQYVANSAIDHHAEKGVFRHLFFSQDRFSVLTTRSAEICYQIRILGCTIRGTSRTASWKRVSLPELTGSIAICRL